MLLPCGRSIATAVAFAGLACSDGGTAPGSNGTTPVAQPAQLRSLDAATTLRVLVTSGDSLPGGPVTFAPAPSGLGLLTTAGDLNLYVSHDIGATPIASTNGGPGIQYARVSVLTLDPLSGAMRQGGLAEDGRNQLQRLAAGATGDVLAQTGFLTTGFTTGEGAGSTPADGAALTIGNSGQIIRRPLYGALTHAGFAVLPVPIHPGTQIATVYVDGTRGGSEVYLYKRDSGGEHVYVLRATTSPSTAYPSQLAQGDSFPVQWTELVDRPDTLVAAGQRFARLQQLVDSAAALPFVRLSAIDLDRSSVDPVSLSPRSGRPPAVYLVDRGDPAIASHVSGAVNATCSGPCDPFGSLYRLDLNTPNVSGPSWLHRTAVSQGPASGWASPGAVATSFTALLIGEAPLHPAFNGTRSAAVWRASLVLGQLPTTYTRLAETSQATPATGPAATCTVAAAGCWDIGAITYAEFFIGTARWVVSVRAHNLPFTAKGFRYASESGQVLLMQTAP